MKLKEYLTHRRRIHGMKLSARQFAKELGITESHLSKIASGKRLPSFRLLKKIDYVSGGKVSFIDFVQ